MKSADGKEIGSSLLGQNFNLPKKNPNDPNEQAQPDPQWFQPRPSAAGTRLRPARLGGLQPRPEQRRPAEGRQRPAGARSAAFDGVDPATVPADALTASGSGLDPDISPAYAKEQVARVAKARGLSTDTVAALVAKYTDGRSLGFLGEPGVNVVLLNKALSETK